MKKFPKHFLGIVKKIRVSKMLKTLISGGERGIRTLERVLAVTRFPIVRLRPAQPSLLIYLTVRKPEKVFGNFLWELLKFAILNFNKNL